MDGNDPSREELVQKRYSLPGHGDVWNTDGSKSEERYGAGNYSRRGSKGTCMSLKRYATICQTEVIALLGFVQRLEDINTGGRDISICSGT